MNKCLGCGSTLQSENQEKEGYVKELTSAYCERCFRIKNYGDYKFIAKSNTEFVEILKDVNKTKDLVLLVVDIFNLPENFEFITKYITNPILLVLTKWDVMPNVYEQKILDYMDKYNLNLCDKIIVSSNKNYNMDVLIDKIKLYQKSKNVYVVGYTNAGKSSLINKLIYDYSENTPTITTSLVPSTTLNSIEVKLDSSLTLIDTPGLLFDSSIDNFVDINMLKKITPRKKIKPITYQVKSFQTIMIEDILALELSNNNINMYFSSDLKIERYYKKRKIDLEAKVIEVAENTDVVISGLGFIKFTKKEKIVLYVIPKTHVFTRTSLI